MTPQHPALVKGHVAVITGAASGIGLAAAKAFARMGLCVVLVDLDGDRLANAAAESAMNVCLSCFLKPIALLLACRA